MIIAVMQKGNKMSDKRIIPKSQGKVIFVPYEESFGVGKDRSKSRRRKKGKK